MTDPKAQWSNGTISDKEARRIATDVLLKACNLPSVQCYVEDGTLMLDTPEQAGHSYDVTQVLREATPEDITVLAILQRLQRA